MFYHVALYSNGRISISKPIREKFHLKTGENLIVSLVNDEIHINTIDKKIDEARNLVKKYCQNLNLVEDLLAMRKEEKDE